MFCREHQIKKIDFNFIELLNNQKTTTLNDAIN